MDEKNAIKKSTNVGLFVAGFTIAIVAKAGAKVIEMVSKLGATATNPTSK